MSIKINPLYKSQIFGIIGRLLNYAKTNYFVKKGKMDTDKKLYSIDAEDAVLGSMLIDPDMIPVVSGIINTTDFYRDKSRYLYTAILEMWTEERPIDIVSLTDWMERKGTLSMVGGAHTITGLITSTPTSAHAEYYAGMIRYYCQMRELVSTCTDITGCVYTLRQTHKDLIDMAIREFKKLRDDYE